MVTVAKIFIDPNEGPCRLIRNPVKFFLTSHFVFKLSNDFLCQLMMSFCLQIIRILYGKKLYLIFGWLQLCETFQLSRINAINIVSSTDVAFKKGISFEGKVVDFTSLWKRGQPCILSRTFCKQNDVISQSYKLVDKNFNDILHCSTVLFICINKNFRFRSPLRRLSFTSKA